MSCIRMRSALKDKITDHCHRDLRGGRCVPMHRLLPKQLKRIDGDGLWQSAGLHGKDPVLPVR